MFVVLLLIGLSFLSTQFFFKMTAAVEYASLTNDINDEELEPVRVFQTPIETTKLFFYEGLMIWVSLHYYPFSSPVTVVQEQESGEPVTVTADYYLTANHNLFAIQEPEHREHEHGSSSIKSIIPPDINNRRIRFLSHFVA